MHGLTCEQIRRALPECDARTLEHLQTEALCVSSFDVVCAVLARDLHAVATSVAPRGVRRSCILNTQCSNFGGAHWFTLRYEIEVDAAGVVPGTALVGT